MKWQRFKMKAVHMMNLASFAMALALAPQYDKQWSFFVHLRRFSISFV
jgi:hypothetical protein